MEITDYQHQLLTCTENLMESASPKDLRDSLEDVFFSYFSESSAVLPSDETVGHIYFLLLFLREVDQQGSSSF